jgi:hypothetical protein
MSSLQSNCSGLGLIRNIERQGGVAGYEARVEAKKAQLRKDIVLLPLKASYRVIYEQHHIVIIISDIEGHPELEGYSTFQKENSKRSFFEGEMWITYWDLNFFDKSVKLVIASGFGDKPGDAHMEFLDADNKLIGRSSTISGGGDQPIIGFNAPIEWVYVQYLLFST